MLSAPPCAGADCPTPLAHMLQHGIPALHADHERCCAVTARVPPVRCVRDIKQKRHVVLAHLWDQRPPLVSASARALGVIATSEGRTSTHARLHTLITRTSTCSLLSRPRSCRRSGAQLASPYCWRLLPCANIHHIHTRHTYRCATHTRGIYTRHMRACAHHATDQAGVCTRACRLPHVAPASTMAGATGAALADTGVGAQGEPLPTAARSHTTEQLEWSHFLTRGPAVHWYQSRH